MGLPYPIPKEIPLDTIDTVSHIYMNRKQRQELVGRLERVLLIKVSRPPLERYNHFQPASRRSSFSKTKFQIALALYLAPNGSLKYFMGRRLVLQSKIHHTLEFNFVYLEV